MRSILAAAALLLAFAASAPAAPRLGNQTQLSFGPDHGTQVEYFGADGSAWLWYPGSKVILVGAWKLEEGDICFRYSAASADPVTGKRGGNWNCIPYELYRTTIAETHNGDVFDLEGRKQVPFTLPRKRLSIGQLQTLARGGSQLAAPAAE